MALKAGRVGVNPNYVDKEGRPLYDNSYLKELLRKEGIITLFTKEGNPISIDNAVAGRVYDLVVSMTPKQTGTGTHSPTNKREISGYSSITIDVNSVDTEVSFESTVYGGTLDLITGILTSVYGIVDLGSLTWTAGTGGTYTRFSSTALTNVKPVSNSQKADALCEIYDMRAFVDVYSGAANNIASISDAGTVSIIDSRYSDAADFKEAMSGIYLIYRLNIEVTAQLTAQAIALATGANTISSDTGTTMDLKYLGTLVPGGANGRSLNRSLSLNREVIDGEEKKEILEEVKEEVPVEEPVTVKKSTKKSTK